MDGAVVRGRHARNGPRPAPGMVRGAVTGFGLGVLWGVAARIWMRLISDHPEFSWAGTLFILVLAGILGTGLGLLAAAKASGRRRWWRLALVPGLLLFAGQGMPFAPAFLVGGLAFSDRRAPLRLLGAAGLLASLGLFGWLVSLEDGALTDTPAARLATLVVGFAALATAVAAGGSVLYRRWSPSTRRATSSPIGSADVAAGEGALAT